VISATQMPYTTIKPANAAKIGTAGSTIRTLAAEAGGARQVIHIEWHAAAMLLGYDEAFAILDAIVRQLSEDTIRPAVGDQPAMVAGVQRRP